MANSSTAGCGHIRARLLPPARLSLPQLTFQYPLKLISSSVPSSKCLTVFILSYGGGLVSNDQVNLEVTIEDSARLCLLTQGILHPSHPVPRGQHGGVAVVVVRGLWRAFTRQHKDF
jgi:urease accessory protein UreH